MSQSEMKRTQSCSLFDHNPSSKKADSCHEAEEVCDSLSSSIIVGDEIEPESLTCSTITSSSLTSSIDSSFPDAVESPRNHVSFSDSVAVRVVYCDSDDDEEEEEGVERNEEDEVQNDTLRREETNVDSVIGLKEEDNSSPFIEPVKFDPEEEAIRSQLVGCICATRRKKHDFGRMYGCGKSISSVNCNDDDSSDEDDDKIREPVRVIMACDASSSWFSFSN